MKLSWKLQDRNFIPDEIYAINTILNERRDPYTYLEHSIGKNKFVKTVFRQSSDSDIQISTDKAERSRKKTRTIATRSFELRRKSKC